MLSKNVNYKSCFPYQTILTENYFEDEWVDVWNRKCILVIFDASITYQIE